MKLLYGVQGTGNGHITRARALNKYLAEFGLEVDFLFSGRDRDRYFDMEEFGDKWRSCRGLTFVHEAGRIKMWRTVQSNSLTQYLKDIRQLDLSPYDAILTDFEPITAWAAKKRNKPCIGIGHQYAFNYDVPKAGDALLPKTVMKYFAPVNVGLGLHWHHFDAPILPPIAETPSCDTSKIDASKIIVYLGFEDPTQVIEYLKPFSDHTFYFYGTFPETKDIGHIRLKPLSKDGFRHDLATANGVISNAGFELSSEAIQLGKKLLIKPLHGQMEQLSNAKALESLGLGMVMNSLDPVVLKAWLNDFESKQVTYPNVARAIAKWISQGQWHNTTSLVQDLWAQVRVEGGEHELLKSIQHPPTHSKQAA